MASPTVYTLLVLFPETDQSTRLTHVRVSEDMPTCHLLNSTSHATLHKTGSVNCFFPILFKVAVDHPPCLYHVNFNQLFDRELVILRLF